ncbi:MAG: ribonuclease P protein component [Proteobacteria bacterium]|nr:ribonuclease P protein component [Pseudomonadota bacterium]
MLDTQRKRQGFSRKHRLNSKKSIDRLFRIGEFKSCGFLKFRYLPQKVRYTRIVVSISKRVGNAAVRNRLKRLIREALRLSDHLRGASMDCAIFVTKPLQKKPTLEEVHEYIGRFFSNLPDETKD